MAVLEVQELTKRYGRAHALRGATFAVGAGSVFGLLGANGAGKTTAFACALGFARPTSGHVEVLGMPPRRLAHSRGRVGVVSDRPALLPRLDARGNLRYVQRFLPRGGRGIETALELVDASDLATRRVGRLSLGQQKRVAIAGALLGEPELIVLDEPLSGLDPNAVASMLELLRRLAASGCTLVLSSHRLVEMESIVTHAAFLHDGRVARAGSLAELIADDGAPLAIEAGPREWVAEVLRARGATFQAVEATVTEGATRFEVHGVASAEINRALIEAGCEVALLQPQRRDLRAVFDEACGRGAASSLSLGGGEREAGPRRSGERS